MSVAELRRAFSEKFPDANQRFEFNDVQRFHSNDAYVNAFLLSNDNNVSDALIQVEKAFCFRRESGINNFTDETFPIEILQKGSIFYRNTDRNGNKILFFRIRENRRDPAIVPIVKNFVAYLIDLEHRRDPGQQIVMLFDMTGAGLANFDTDLVRFIITCFDTYFPHFLAYLLVYDMPFILNAAWRLIRNWLSEKAREKIIFVKKKDIIQYVAPDQLLQHMGGTDDFEFVYGEVDNANAEFNGDAMMTFSNSLTHDETDACSELRRRARNVEGDVHLTRSLSVDDTSLTSTQRRGTNTSPPSVSSSSAVSSGPLLQISPSDFLIILPNETSHTMHIKNLHSTEVVFKVNTTLPNDFRIRPSHGLLASQEDVEVSISWKAAASSYVNLTRGRFQVVAMPVPAGTQKTAALTALRSASRDALWEHRLSCCGRTITSGANAPASGEVASLQSISDRLARVEAAQKEAAERAKSIFELVRLLCVLSTAAVVLLLVVLLALLLRR